MEAVHSRLLKESAPSEVSRYLESKHFSDQAPVEDSASLEKFTPSEESITLEKSPPSEQFTFPNQSASERQAFVKGSIQSEESAPLEEPARLKKSMLSTEPLLPEDSTPREDSKYTAEPVLSDVLKLSDVPVTLESTGLQEPLSSEELASLEDKMLLEQPKSLEKSDFSKDHPSLDNLASIEVSKPVEVSLPIESTFDEAASSKEGRSAEERALFENSEKSGRSSPLGQSTFIEKRTPFEEFKTTPPESLLNRDSAIHVSDSPILPNRFPVYQAPRDSGYQDTVASAFTNIESMAKESKDMFTQEATTHMGEEHVEEQNERQILRTPAPETHWEIPAEPEPDYAVSIQATALGFIDVNDEEHLTGNTLPLIDPEKIPSPTDQAREPSPVDSTTKDRSSVLFQSSPSSRDVLLDQRSISQSPPHDDVTTDQARPDSWTLPPWSPTGVPTADVQIGSDSANPASETFERPSEKAPETILSPVGSLVDAFDDRRSPSRSPFTSSDNAKQHRLDTITEYSPEESPLQRKHPALPATGSPEPKMRSRRVSLSSASSRRQHAHPSFNTAAGEDFISTDDIISRLSWPSVDDESHTVDLERSRSRNQDKSSVGRTSLTSTPGAGLIKNREHDHRSVSGGSVGSVESITAIIRTPDQARPLSRLSQRSLATPPLRRTDRSVSGDLRLANILSGAKPRAKTIGAETDVEIGAGVNEEKEGHGAEGAVSTTIIAPPAPTFDSVPSASTYDPAKDKGKSRLIDMADVYVSFLCLSYGH